MEKINRPTIQDIPSLAEHEETLNRYNNECARGIRSWESSSVIYNLLRNELKILTNGHCSFCDGYPLNDTSKETIEHYFPKAEYKDRTYEWGNLFYTCDKCQSYSNSHRSFVYTLKMDDEDYSFDRYFWFDAESGEVRVYENLSEKEKNDAINFLERYGINNSDARKMSRRQKYNDLIVIFKSDSRERNYEPYRFVFDIAFKTSQILTTLP